MRKKTLRTKIMCSLLSLVFLASILNVQLPAEAKASTATIPITVGGKTYQVTPGQNVTVNTPGGSTTYNVRFVDGKPVALEMTQYQQILFGDGSGATTNAGASQSSSSSSSKPSSSSSSSSNAAQSSSSSSSSSAAQSSSSAAQTTSSSSSNGQMSWNEFQKANSGKGMSSSEMSQAWKDYKAGNTSSSSAAQSGSTSSNTSAPQASVAEGASSSNAAQGTTVSETSTTQTKTSNWDPAKHPRDPQTGKFISHEEAIARGLMDPADASTSSQSSQTAQSGEATQTTGSESGNAAQATQSTETAQASGEKTKTSIGDKFKSGYETGKNLTNQGFQNVKDSLKSGFSAKNLLVTAGITVGVDLATQVMRGENPSLKTALKTVCCAEFVGSVSGSVLGSAAGSFFVPFLSCIPVVGGALSALAPTFGSVVGSSVGAYVAGDLKNGRFSIKEAFKRIDWVGVTGQTIGSTVGAALGSCLGPVGTVIGGMVGGYFGNWAAHKIAGLFGKGEANLPSLTMPTGETGNELTTAGTITLGGDDVTGVTISDAVVPESNDDNDSRTSVEASEVSDDITAAYEEYTAYYEEYSRLIQSGKQAEAVEVAQKMNAAKAKYDSLRYND